MCRSSRSLRDSGALFALWLAATAIGSLGLLPVWKRAIVSSDTSNAVLLSIVVLPAVIGAVIALGQWLVLRRVLRLHVWGWWVAGGAVNALAIVEIIGIGSSLGFTPDIIAPMGMVTGIVAACANAVQWSTLRGAMPASWLWILLSIVAGGVGWPIGVIIGIALFGVNNGLAIGWFGLGICNGIAMLWLASTSHS